MSQYESRIPDMEDRIAVSVDEKRYFLKIARNRDKSIQQLRDDTKKNNMIDWS